MRNQTLLWMMHVKTLCDRLLSPFKLVAATFLFIAPWNTWPTEEWLLISLRSNSALTREKPIMRCSTRRRRRTTSCTLSTSTSDRFSTYTPFFPSSRIWETQQGRTLESSLMFTEPFPGRQTMQNLNSQDCYQTLYLQICRWWFKQVSDLLIVDLQERALADIPQILMLAMFFILPHSGALL